MPFRNVFSVICDEIILSSIKEFLVVNVRLHPHINIRIFFFESRINPISINKRKYHSGRVHLEHQITTTRGDRVKVQTEENWRMTFILGTPADRSSEPSFPSSDRTQDKTNTRDSN